MLQIACPVFMDFYFNDIESKMTRSPTQSNQIRPTRPQQRLPLSRIHGIKTQARRIQHSLRHLSRLHFNKHQILPFPRHNVQFIPSRPPVSRHHPPPLPAQIARRHRLPIPTDSQPSFQRRPQAVPIPQNFTQPAQQLPHPSTRSHFPATGKCPHPTPIFAARK